MIAENKRTATYALDASHSTVEFVVRHLMISKVRGRFGTFAGTIGVPEGSDLPSFVDVAVDVGSIDTHEDRRDAHLRSADFFDAERFPEMSFKSTRIEGNASKFRLIGDLTIRGTTREVALEGELEGRGADPWGGERIAYSAHGKIDRREFGLLWNQALETGGVVVGDEVRIELNVEAVLQH